MPYVHKSDVFSLKWIQTKMQLKLVLPFLKRHYYHKAWPYINLIIWVTSWKCIPIQNN